jgi:hypothetical protein
LSAEDHEYEILRVLREINKKLDVILAAILTLAEPNWSTSGNDRFTQILDEMRKSGKYSFEKK